MRKLSRPRQPTLRAKVETRGEFQLGEMCLCYDEKPYHHLNREWDLSKHAAPHRHPSEMGGTLCAQCHNGLGSVDFTDGDGLANGFEFALGTTPTAADSDHDGYHDGAELALGNDPLSADDNPDVMVHTFQAAEFVFASKAGEGGLLDPSDPQHR